MGFDVQKWLTEDMGFSADDAAKMAPKFSTEAIQKLTADERQKLTREREELTAAQTKLTEANDRLNRDMAEWATLTGAEKAEATELRNRLEAEQAKVFTLTQKVERIATEQGLDAKKLLEGVTVTDPPKPKDDKPPIDTSKFVTTDQFGQVAKYMIDLPADLAYIGQQHKALTGEDLDPRQIVAEVKKRAGKGEDVSPVAIWEGMYDIPAKRAAAEKAKFDQAIKEAEARGAERVRSEASLPPSPVPGRQSPVFGQRTAEGTIATRTSVLKRPQPGTIARTAAAALRSGKYREKSA